jgi:hypothetical protein
MDENEYYRYLDVIEDMCEETEAINIITEAVNIIMES